MDHRRKQILIIGIAGGLAQLLAKLILQEHPDFEIIGVDSRSIEEVPKLKGLQTMRFRFSRGNFEKIFRENSFHTVYHLARISHSSMTSENLKRRLELSVMGTNRILDLSLRFHIKKVIVLSTFHVYGALADNPIFLDESAPLRASMKHSALRDVVEMDQICTNWMYKHQDKMDTIVLRPCNIIGNKVQNTMSSYLTSPFALNPIDYNPVFQFIHEFDMAMVLYKSLEDLSSGIFNVATDDYISLSDALKTLGNRGIPFPMAIAGPVNKMLKQINLDIPSYLIDYLKYSCLINNKEIKKHLGDKFYRFSIEDTLKLTRLN